ncbi:Rieske (2Fe-2S) protein [Tepidibacillus sp. LV47]|uniref:Rieske (2Fe-2S) protein n=1 Tax=Tepidibacillus sp. LV47 TaxID=3398228 RepID=UPI003AB07DBF
MNRAEFLSQMKKSLFGAAKEFVSPLIEEDFEKIDQFLDEMAGMKWLPLGQLHPNEFIGVKDLFLENRSISLYSNGKEMKALDKTCPACHSLIHWIPFEKKLICLACNKQYFIEKSEGEFTPKFYSLKEKNGKWFILVERGG